MHYIVYETTNTLNGKIYVGSHESKTRTDSYLGSGKALKTAIHKYHKENFTRDNLIYAVSSDVMYWFERMIVDDYFIEDRNTYNLKVGGEGGFGYINRNNLNGRNGQDTWNKSIKTGPMVDETKSKIANTLKLKYTKEVHHSKGKPPWNKGLKTGPAWNKGLKAETKECPHCLKQVNAGNYTRWHGDNCKAASCAADRYSK